MANNLVLVTGASSDIGLALIGRLLSAPEPPTILAHSYTGGSSIQALKSEFGDRVQPLQADFTKCHEVSAMADLIIEHYGVPARIVHMPALQLTHERFSKFPWDQFKRDMDVQVHSAMILLQRFLPQMAKMPGARVVFMLSSVTQGLPPKFMSYYVIVKYAELGLMRALAAEYASSSVRINGISPSMVETKFLQQVSAIAVQMAAKASPLGRNATPEDLLGAIEFLLSPGAEYMTGIDIPITAGSTC